jgi:hypothetical protein
MTKKPKSGPLLPPIPMDFATAVRALAKAPLPPKAKKAIKRSKAKRPE